MIVVQEQPIFRRYLAPFVSVASVFQLVCVAASVVVPFIIAFGTSGETSIAENRICLSTMAKCVRNINTTQACG